MVPIVVAVPVVVVLEVVVVMEVVAVVLAVVGKDMVAAWGVFDTLITQGWSLMC